MHLSFLLFSQETQTLKRLVLWSLLLWSQRQPSCRLGCKHFRVVVHGLLQVTGPFTVVRLFLLGIVSMLWQGELVLIFPDTFCSEGFYQIQQMLFVCLFNFFRVSRLFDCFITAWRDSTWQYHQPVEQVEVQKKGSGSTINKTERGGEVVGVEEGDRRGVKSVTQPKNQCHAPGARASKSKQQECEGNEWECKSCHSHGECFLFSPLACTTYRINISQSMGTIWRAKLFNC